MGAERKREERGRLNGIAIEKKEEQLVAVEVLHELKLSQSMQLMQKIPL